MASNGGSLEDCFSNVFALTELNGLKWRCFLTPQNAPRGVPIPSDPVLKAYGRCLQDGLICTWRRKPLQIPTEGPEPLPLPSFTNDISKELWLFWYSSEPPEGISEYTSHLEGDESGVGSALNGISYEVRVLFFKALHTGIERSVSKAGFVRFGRWFTRPLRQPLSGRQHLLSHYVLAFNMQFFIHGGNTVCMTLNAQRQPPLLRLAKRHLDCGRRVQVVVGPWSLRAVLLPGDTDAGRNQASADRQWEEWKEFVALGHDPEDLDDESREEGVPRMVTLELDGIRMLYPSCYVCVTMEDDAASCPKESQSAPVPPMTPDELITSDNGRRNRLLVSNVNGQMYMQGVLQNAHLSRRNITTIPAAPQNGPFQAPYPPQSDDETKWNFADPCRPDTCTCDECKFQPSAEYWNSLEKQKVEDIPMLYTPIRVTNMKCTQLKTNPAYNLLRKQVKRKSKYSYHRRHCLSSTADSASLPRLSSPEEDTVDTEHDTSDDDIIHPAWADASKESLVTGIYCSADDASYHYGVATPCNSSDDENLACSPFTPIKVVSPCSDCAWPSAPADQISEAVFNEIFHPGNSSRVPPTASQEERQRDYDCYYNPTLREEPYYMSYHSRRYGEKRRSCYPPNIRMPLSPDQPGSQETIPATTSPPPELDDSRRRPVDSTMSLSMAGSEMRKIEKETTDEPVLSRKRPRKVRRKIDWPDLDTLDVAFMSSDVGEELKERISPYAGRITPRIDMDSEVEMDDKDVILDKEETRAIGEGTSGIFISDGNPRSTHSTADEMMDVDDGTMTGPTDNILSPPASNERPEAYAMMAMSYGWPRVGGPPSAGDPSMNHIYPTPPSVQSEAQQFSPAPVLPPHSTVINTNQSVVLDTTLMNIASQHQLIIMNAKTEPQIPEPLQEMEDDEQKPLVPLGSTMDKLLNRINNTPVSGYVRKQIVPSSSRFSAVEDKVALCSAIAHRRGPVHMPPDYHKPVSNLDKRVPKQLSVELLLSFPSNIPSTAPSQMTPVTSFSNPGYKPNFGAISGATTTTSSLPSMGAIPPMQHQQITGFPNSQIRTPPMIMGRSITSHGLYGTPTPYGAPVTVPYSTMIPQQPQNSVQQLNNFVHGPMFNSGGAGGMNINQHIYPGSTHPQMQMVQSGYGGPPGMINYGINSIGGGAITPAASIGGAIMTGSSSSYSGGSQAQYNQMGASGSMQPMRPVGMGNLQQQPPLPGHMMTSSFGTGNIQGATQREGSSFAEGTSVVLAIILQDTILDLHYDSVFDACPICSCNTSIRARELGLYILPHEILRMPVSQQKEKIGPWSGFALEQANTCNCGFSAVRHRYLSLCSGLFSDDSEEATAIPIKHSVAAVNGIGEGVMQPSSQIWFDASTSTDMNMLDLLRILCQQRNMGKTVHQIAVFSEYADKAIKPQEVAFDVSSNAEFMVSKVDSAELVLIGNSAAEMALVSGSRSRSNNQAILQFFHPWGLQVANEVREPREAEWRGLLSEIGPILEQAMRIVRCTQGSGNIVEGPLTWRSLTTKSLKSATGQEEDSFLPEPIPCINIATEKEAIRAAPQIIRHWEQMSLGPIDQPKDVLYLSVIPDNADIHAMTIKYMDQMSQMYERMRLGRHIAWVSGDNRDGCVRVGGRSGTGKYTAANTTLDFLNLVTRYVDNKVFITRLRLFTQQMEESVQQLLLDQDHMFDRTAFRETLAHDMRAKRAAAAAIAQAAERSTEGSSQSFLLTQQPIAPQVAPQKGGISVTQPSPMESSSLHDLLNLDPASTQSQPPATSKEEPPLEPEDIPVDDYGTLPHCVVIYVFNPFTWGTEYRSGIYARVATLALMRAFNAVCVRLPPRRRPQLQLEIIGMEQVTDLLGSLPDYMNDGKSHQDVFESSGSERELFDGYMATDSLRATALSVYTQPRVLSADCIKSVQARCMTKFGPGSSLMDAIDEWERSGTAVLYKVPSNAFCLAPPPFLTQKQEGGKVIQTSLDEQVLYVTYCLIGSDWLCATVTDAQGRLNDNCLINLRTRHDPNIYKYRAKTQILDAMGRLWTYIIGVLSMETRNWRLVIGRLGRIGHGEFRAWTHLLNKQALRRHSARLKEVCSACAQMPGGGGTPAILSACLISTEPEPNLRIFPGYSANDSYGKRVRPLSTPEDTSCTHIMVFPTGADIQLGSGDQQADGEDDFDFDTLHDIEQDGDEMGMGQDFVSSLMLDSNLDGPQPSAGFRTAGGTFFPDNAGDISVENQPLATGFYVSTSPAADLPDWFWASCPGAKRRAPVHLKSSLHINVPLVQQEDEYLRGKSSGTDKLEKESPLDSARTDEVLRHVLETYNALSWLSVDLVSGERRSCLPIHIQALLRLYHSVCRLIM